MRRLAHAFAFATLLAFARSGTEQADRAAEEAVAVAAVREYVPGAWSTSFYRPHQLKITGIGLINQETAYFSTRWGVSELQNGHLQHLKVEVGDAEISAFHLCHHRSSFFYEVRARDGSTVTIFEHSLSPLFEKKLQVWQQEDVSPATSLACVDKLLLRASPSSLLAINVESAEAPEEHTAVSVLSEYDPHDSEANVITSLAVGYAADVYTRAQVYALVPHNRTLLRLHLETEYHTEKVVAESEPLLHGGDGSDGALASASTHEPLFILSVHDSVLFADGCSLRQISDGRVRTLLGTPTGCIAPQNETVEPVPWASRLSRPQALAGAAEETLDGTVLALTGSQVFSVVQREEECAKHIDADECSAQSGCAWGQGENLGERLCFGCDRLHDWASRQGKADNWDICLLEMTPRAGTSYNLMGCGCVAPPPLAPDPDEDGSGLSIFQSIVGGAVIIAVFCCLLSVYRSQQRAAQMRELYGAETCEFHVFNNDDEP